MLTADRSKLRRRRRLFILSLALALTSFSLSLPAEAQLGGKPEKSSFSVSYTQASGAFTPLWVALETGLFKKHGLDASLKMLNSQVALQALVAGEVDVISSGPDLVNARLQNDPTFAASPSDRLEFFLRRHSSWDARYNLYPVLRVDTPL